MNGFLTSLWRARVGSSRRHPRGRSFSSLKLLTLPSRQGARREPLPALEHLEARDLPAATPVFITLVNVPGFDASTGTKSYDQINFTYNGVANSGAGAQLGMKLSTSPATPPAGTTPDFYGFCVDLAHPINLNSPYLVQPTSAVTGLPNGAAVSYLYDNFATPNAVMPKELAAGLQLAIWEKEFGSSFKLTSVQDLGNHGADVTALVQGIANLYLAMIPPSPTAQATFYDSTLGGTVPATEQGVIGPPPVVPPSIDTTQQPASATVGSTIADKATVSGGTNPTGTVTFNLYNNPNGTGTPLFTDTEPLSGGMATSKGYVATATGTDFWVATYNGDANNPSVTSGTALEPVTITPATPVINTCQQPATATVGSTFADQAFVTGGDNPTGTVTFNLYNNPNGTGTPLFTDANEPLVNGVATSKGFVITTAGTDYWVATYNGDANNVSVTSGTALEPVIITPAGPSINTIQQPATAVVGSSIADKAIVTGGNNPTGTVTFNLYNNPSGTGTPLFTDANEPLVNGMATSKGFVATVSGTDYWVATYNGDTNNAPITSGTALEPVNVVNAVISITPLTPVNPVGSPEVFTVTATAFPAGTGTPNFGTLNVIVSGGLTPTITGPTIIGNTATWSVTINSNTSGTFTVQASDTVTMGGVPVTRTTGDGFTSSDGSDSASAVKNYVDALIAISPLTPVNPLGSPETFTITVTAFPAGTGVPSFTTPTVTFPGGAPSSVGPVTPLSGPTLQPNGSYIETWTETINSNTPGTFTVQASDTVTMGGVPITRTTGDGFSSGDGSDSPSAVKRYVSTLTIVTTQQPATATVGASIADQATVSGGNNPTGTVTFNLYNNPSGTGTPLFTDANEPLVNGMATSKGFVATVSGTDYWVATYNGDANNAPITSGTALEPVNVVNAVISITPLTPVNPVGSPEVFTVTATAFPAGTGTPNFGTLHVTVSGGLTPTISAPMINGNMATWSVTINSNTSGTFTVQASDTVTMGGVPVTRTTGDGFTSSDGSDSASAVKNYVDALIAISPLTPVNPLGSPETFTITVTAFPAGTGVPSFTTPTVTFPGGAPSSVGPVTPLSGPTLQPNGSYIETWTETINSNTPGTFTVQASDTVTMGGVPITRTTGDNFSSGDGSDSPSAVKRYVSTLTIVTTQQPATATVGASIADQATVSGGNNPTGTVTFNLYNNPNGTGTPLFTDANEPLVNGVATSKGFVTTTAGTDYWVATYNGDANNAPVTSGTALEPVTVQPSLTTSPFVTTTTTPTLSTTPGTVAPPAPCDDNFYPNNSTALTAVPFNESTALAGISPNDGTTLSMSDGTLKVFYTDEHALALGVSSVTNNGVTTNYTVSTTPGANGRVQTGAPYTPPANAATASPSQLALQGGTDTSGRPLGPSLYVTDITGLDPNSVAAHAGDWQYGGSPLAPNNVFGPTKAFTEVISNGKVTLTAGQDPQQNKPSDLPDPFPSGVKSEGYTAEATWNINSLGLIPGHQYRFYVMVHDGDQNKTGGDVGQACADLLFTGATGSTGASGTLTDSATLAGGNNPTGTLTFYLFAPGVTPNADNSNAVYKNVVQVNGNGTYTTAMGSNPGGFTPPSAGVFQWVVVYSGDANNGPVTSPLGSEPSVMNVAPCNDNFYPNNSTALTAVPFNESTALAGISPNDGTTLSMSDGTLKVFYTDEHALALGVSSVTNNGVTTNYTVSTTPGANGRVQTGAPYTPPANAATASPSQLALQGGTDTSGRPLGPSLYVTDITGLDPNSVAAHAGDWQYGGSPLAPNNVFGPTKAFTEVISNGKVTLTAGKDPAKNSPSDLPDPFPSGVQSLGYTAEATWNVSSLGLIPGHVYRFYVMVHDGDQNKTGGDVGQACVDLVFTGSGSPGSGGGTFGGGTISKLNDSATLSGGNNPTGTLTFTLLGPGSTSDTALPPIYTDVVQVNGNGTYTTAMGNNPGGFAATLPGTYQWIVAYSGDSSNPGAISPFGSEPQPFGPPPPPSQPNLNIVKTVTANQTVIQLGGTASFTITVSNQNPAGGTAGAASNVVLTDQLPDASQLTWSVTSSTGFATASVSSSGVLTATDSSLPGGGTATVVVSATVPLNFFGTTSGNGAGNGDSVPLNLFELDGNATTGVLGTTGSTTPSHDWDQVFADNSASNSTNTAGALASTFVTDPVNSKGDNIFTEGGSKDPNPISQWVNKNGNVPDKDDIENAFAAEYKDPATNDVIVYAGLDRYASNGDSTAGFWFFVNPVSVNGNGGFTGSHSNGDILLVCDFTNGGKISTFNVYEWSTVPVNGSNLVPVNPGNSVFGVVNSAPISVPWQFVSKDGGNQPNAGQFLEVGINLSGLGLNGCFSSFLAETRASQSLTSTLKDFVVESFQTCNVTLPNQASVKADNVNGGQPITSNQVTININDGMPAPQLAAGSSSQAGAGQGELLPSATLHRGTLTVAVDLPQGPNAAAEAAAVARAIASLDTQLAPLGVALVKVTGAAAATASIHISMASTTSIGGVGQGVLGAFSNGNITLVSGWSWYFGSNPGGIGAGQYDFQSVVTHELGHALGLGENSDAASAMGLYLGTGQVHRSLTANDVAAVRSELQASTATPSSYRAYLGSFRDRLAGL